MALKKIKIIFSGKHVECQKCASIVITIERYIYPQVVVNQPLISHTRAINLAAKTAQFFIRMDPCRGSSSGVMYGHESIANFASFHFTFFPTDPVSGYLFTPHNLLLAKKSLEEALKKSIGK